MNDYRIEYDGDLWCVFVDGEHFDCFSMIDEAARAVVELVRESPPKTQGRLRQLFIEADSELSAIAHGRPPSDKAELLRMSDAFRKLYENRKRNYPS